ncbi:uncharacterized protein LOC126325479 [Schistocerca gregaria]|uniref:uncharacterized protein LOC126325479 n=1 Tax=Schistocerca gregaria TaxID=7010 RepID=UPI00211DD5D6|nr:uncharacterized protein LOC126325479 [Schistocerca gregaria]
MTSVLGHLQNYTVPQHIESNWNVNPLVLFDTPLQKKTTADNLPIERMLQDEARRCKWLILWLDCDREGENIAYEVIDICTHTNQNLRILRARFSALIPRDIHRALRELASPDQRISDAVDARQEIDLRIGFAFTRFQTTRWRSKFAELSQGPAISYGPCQFPTLGFVVDRYWKHVHFQPEDYWTIRVLIEKQDQVATFLWSRVHLFDHMSCVILYQLMLENPVATITKVEVKPTSKARPYPLTTVQMQKMMAKKFNMSARQAMNIAESLYQHGWISYPRTETDSFAPNFDLRSLVQEQASSSKWGSYAADLIKSKFRLPRSGKHNDRAHPPIYPTKFTDALKDDHARVYEFVVRHFLACCSEDAVGEQAHVEAQIGDETFKCDSLVILQKNYLDVYEMYQGWKEEVIPRFKVGEQHLPKEAKILSKKTTPPPLLKEADLIQLMHQHGIGTDSTIAEHIHTILQRNYVVKKKNELVPTKLGEALVAGYNFVGYRKLNQPQLRAQMESDMQRICTNQAQKADVVKFNIDTYREIFIQLQNKASKLDRALSRYFNPIGTLFKSEQPGFSKCGKCGRQMSLRLLDNDRHSLHCEHCDESFVIPLGKVYAFEHTCPICSYQVVRVLTLKEKMIHVCPYCYNYPPAQFSSKPPDSSIRMLCLACPATNCELSRRARSSDAFVRSCPVCGAKMVLRTSKTNQKKFLACTNYPGCTKILWLPDENIDACEVLQEKCPACSRNGTDSYLVRFRYTAREAFETGRDFETGCLGSCHRPGDIVKEWLRKRNKNWESWETSGSDEFSVSANKETAQVEMKTVGRGNTSLPQHRNKLYAESCGSLSVAENSTKFPDFCSRSASDLAVDRKQQHVDRSSSHKVGVPRRASFSSPFKPTDADKPTSSSVFDEPEPADGQHYCMCGHPALCKVAKTPKNHGRHFYACEVDACNFFLWKEGDQEWDAMKRSVATGSTRRNLSVQKHGRRGSASRKTGSGGTESQYKKSGSRRSKKIL